MTKQLTCIVCPKGCRITVEYENSDILNVFGYTCKRGLAYAKDEVLDPKRTITTTVKADDGSVVSVKTDKAISKNLIFEAMKEINSTKVDLPVCVGDIIIDNLLNTDVSVVATCNKII